MKRTRFPVGAAKNYPTPGNGNGPHPGTRRKPKMPIRPNFRGETRLKKKYANAWVSGVGNTVSVENYYKGSTPNGVYQLIGNTWEMTSNRFVFQNSGANNSDLGEVRGGAFDTYLDCQMTCQFRTGLPLLFRGSNVGFRCIASVSDLHRPQ